MCAYNWPGPYPPPRRSVIVRAGEQDTVGGNSRGVITKRVCRTRKHAAVSPSTSTIRRNSIAESPPDSLLLDHRLVSSPSSPSSSSSSCNSVQSSPWSSSSIRCSGQFPSSAAGVHAPTYRLDNCFSFNNAERLSAADEEMRLINSVCRFTPYATNNDQRSSSMIIEEYVHSPYSEAGGNVACNQNRCDESTFRFCEEDGDGGGGGGGGGDNDQHRVKTTIVHATSSSSSGGVVHHVRDRASGVNWSTAATLSCCGAQSIGTVQPIDQTADKQFDGGNGQIGSYDTDEKSPQEMTDFMDVNQADSDGDLLIHIAVAKENELQVSQLIHLMMSSNKSLDIYNKMKQTPLHVAIMTGHLNILRRLLSAGCSPRLPDRHGNSALHLAVRSSSLACVNVLLECPSSVSALDQRNYNGFTPLHLAVFRRDTDLVGLLVAKGAECNVVDGTSGRTPLYHATLNGHEDVVRKLISLGASVNVANYAGITPLVVATDRRQKTITSLLISRGATINPRDDNT